MISFLLLLLAALTSCQSSKLLSRDDPARQVVEQHAEQQKKKYNIELVAKGCTENEKIEEFQLHYLSLKKLEQWQVRKLLVLSIEEFLQTVNANEAIRDLLESYPMSIEQLRYNIGFCNIEGDFHEPPYIAYAYLKEGRLYYCNYDNLFGTFIDYEDVEESYEEARQIVMGEN